MHVVRLLLKTTTSDERELEKRFYAISHIHNVLVKHARTLIKRLRHDPDYTIYYREYTDLLKSAQTSDKARKKELSRLMNDIRISMGLYEYGFQKYIKVCASRYKKLISSQQVQKEASRVWTGVEKVLFSDGRELHFKKQENFHTIGGKSNLNGARFDPARFCVEWTGLHLPCVMPRKQDSVSYIAEALNDDISYCDIERKMFPNGWHYYVIIVLKGDAPRKYDHIKDDGITGIDIGVSTVAAVSQNTMHLNELAPECRKYNKQIDKLLYRMDISRRNSNPHRYNPDGTINKAIKGRWICSKTYIKNRQRLRSLYRQKAEYINQSHERLVNDLIKESTKFIVEDMTFKGLQRRSKKIQRSEKLSPVKSKHGTRMIAKYQRRKRFGRSLNNRAPAKFLMILERKATQYGGYLQKVDTRSFRASQYDHVDDTYTKVPLNQRIKKVGGHIIQRDLYSAFLLQHSNLNLKTVNRASCTSDFENFVAIHNDLINRMKAEHVTMKQCFGF